MAAPSKAFTTVPDSAIDADSPLTEDLMEDFRDNDIFLNEVMGDTTLYGAFETSHTHTGSDGTAPIPGAGGGINLVVGKFNKSSSGITEGPLTAKFRPEVAIYWPDDTTLFADFRMQHVDGGTVGSATGGLAGAGSFTNTLTFGGVQAVSSYASGRSLNFIQMQSESTFIDVNAASSDGTGSQEIVIGFQADVVMVFQGINSAIRTAGFTGTTSRNMDGVWQAASSIIDISASSFSVGSNITGAASGDFFSWIAMKSDISIAGEHIELEAYTGNGVASQSTAAAPLSAAADGPPQAAIIVNTDNTGTRIPNIGSQRTAVGGNVSLTTTAAGGGIETFHATGVTVDAGNDVNANTESYEIIYFFGGRL